MPTLYNQLQSLNIITPTNQVNKQARRMLHNHPGVEQAIIDSTAFLYTDADIVIRIRCMIEGIDTQPTCAQCGRPLVPLRYKHSAQRFIYMCQNTPGKSCAASNKTVMDARERTLIERYGVSNPSQNADVRRKTVATNMERYGGVAPACSITVRDKAHHTISSRPSEVSESIIARRQSTTYKKYGALTHAQSVVAPEVLQRIHQYSYDPEWLYDQHIIQGKTITDIANIIGVSTSVMCRRFERLNIDIVRHHTPSSRSAGELDMVDFIRTVLGDDVEIVTNDRSVIAPKELDVFIPRYNIAFEYCGVYWHSEGHGRSRLYHTSKTADCAAKGIRLIQIWSSEWTTRPELVRSRIRNILRKNTGVVYARKCTIQPISAAVANAFISNTHIQGRCSAPINYGLYEDGVRLVAVMSFGKDRFSSLDRYELVRFATVGDSTVMGGASKLLRAFIKDHPPKPIVSYSDRRWNTGGVYKQLGFEYSHTSSPNYFYFDTMGDTEKLLSRHNFQKHKLSSKLEIFDPSLTEWENMRMNGYDRIWDCGNDVFVYHSNDMSVDASKILV